MISGFLEGAMVTGAMVNRQLRAEGAIFLGGSYGEKPGSYGDFEILRELW